MESSERIGNAPETIADQKDKAVAAMLLNEDVASSKAGGLSALTTHDNMLTNNQTSSADVRTPLVTFPSSPKPVTEAYGTTLFLLAILHIIYIRQWNARIKRSDVSVNYRTIVRRKQFHKVIGALLSTPTADQCVNATPPADAMGEGVATRRRNNDRSISMGSDDYGNQTLSSPNAAAMSLLSSLRMSIRRHLHPLTDGHLSSFPCLFINCYILWQCRALEELYDKDSSWGYLRVLIGLTVVSLTLELLFLHKIVSLIPTGAGSSAQTQHRKLLDKDICTITSTVAAVMTVFASRFPHVPIDAFPLMRWVVYDPSLCQWICMTMLLLVSARLHQFTGVMSGILSGILWSSGWTSWLGSLYWGNCMLLDLILLCTLSAAATGRQRQHQSGSVGNRFRSRGGHSSIGGADLLPFIDYVGWDERGVMHN